jgi:site-specific DNA-methyltransferase (adenine-specific)
MLPPPLLTTARGKLYADDCLTIMRQLPAESIDVFFADPPFNLNKDYGPGVNDAIKEEDYLDWCRQWMTEGIRLLKPGGSFFVYNIPRWNAALASFLMQHLTFRHWVAINLTLSLPIAGRLYPSHYSLLYFTKGPKPNTFHPDRLLIDACRHCGGELRDYGGHKSKMNPAGVTLSDVWNDIAPVRHSRFKNREANELSIKLMDRIIEMSSDKGDVIFDPFGGSGTTYAAAELKGRQWIGTEISTGQAIVDRFADPSGDEAMLHKCRGRVNKLFLPETLSLRTKNGHRNDRYPQMTSEGDDTDARPADGCDPVEECECDKQLDWGLEPADEAEEALA